MSELNYNQWSTMKPYMYGLDAYTSWVPEEDRERIAAYIKYDQMYWNDPKQYSLRVLDGETPLYIPNARTVVDTTAHYLLKGLEIKLDGNETSQKLLSDFLKRETFYSRFNTAKLAGVARGDFVFHMTANPSKAEGTRISLNSVDPASVFPIWDEHEPGKMVGCHIAVQYTLPPPNDDKTYVRKLTYRLIEDGLTRRVSREEGIYEMEEKWYGVKPKLFKQVLPLGLLDPRITAIPVYMMKNRAWDGEDFGSSELRGLETIAQTISQGSTDVSAALALEGLGVYATDGGRPLNEDGTESEWEVAPGRVMEVPTGSYFRRVEGVGSITPAVDQIDYLERKINTATGLTDVALGTVDAQVASSGIALAIKFMPTLAKIETRDQHGKDILTQLFYDLKTWFGVFERKTLDGDIIPVIGDKLPIDRTERINELNNMLDRRVISNVFYRQEMTKLGYVFPTEEILLQQITDDLKITRLASEAAKPAEDKDDEDSDEDSKDGDTLPEKENQSNNRNRPNESSGTEAKDGKSAKAREAQKKG